MLVVVVGVVVVVVVVVVVGGNRSLLSELNEIGQLKRPFFSDVMAGDDAKDLFGNIATWQLC